MNQLTDPVNQVFSTVTPLPPPPPEGALTEVVPEFSPPEVQLDSAEAVIRLIPAEFRTYYPPGRKEYYRLRLERSLLIWMIRQILQTWTPPTP